jgi:TATA-binding protein-associated factor
LCDDMGLGKTLQAICIMASDDFYRRQNYTTSPTPNFAPLPSLVVCPPTLVGHWHNEILKFCDASIKPLSYLGSPADRANLRKQFKDHTILIMSYDIVRNDIEHLNELYFNYCVLDEGHIIKNSKTKITKAVKQIRANHRLILSGTPIQNNVLELWSLFDFLMPGFLGTEKQFNDIYSKPILASKDPKCSTKEQETGALAIESLHRQVLPFLLRRLKEDVLNDLPPKIIQDYYCDLSPIQVRLYETFSSTPAKQTIDNTLDTDEAAASNGTTKSKGKVKGKKGEVDGANHIFQALQYLRKLCDHPLLVLNPQHPEYDTIMKELKLNKSSLHDLSHAPKLLALKELLHECGIGVSSMSSSPLLSTGTLSSSSSGGSPTVGVESVTSQHRVLIFAQMKGMLDIIEHDLLKVHMPTVTYLRMDGTTDTNKRQGIVAQFNSDPTIDLLLLTTHVGGLGLNLTGADTVIFVEHDWNPMRDLQAMDRAHRLGQKKVVNVYRLITRGTLEEKIMGLQKFKLNIANTVVNRENTSLSTMSTDQLLDLFSYSGNGKNKKGDTTNKSTAMDITDHSFKKGGKLKSVLDSLEELWDESQYEEYNLGNFLGQLNSSL